MKEKTSFSTHLLGREISERAKWTADRELDLRDRIQSLIEERDFNQTNVAKKMGTSRSVVSEWLSGKRKITHKTLAKFEKAFNVKLWDLYERPVIQRVAVTASLKAYGNTSDGKPKEIKTYYLSSFNKRELQTDI